MTLAGEIKRRFNWWLKHRFTYTRTPHRRPVALDTALAALDAPGQTRWAALAQRYPDAVHTLKHCDAAGLRESLYFLDILDLYLPMRPPLGRSLDIGARNWAYLPGLMAYAPGPWCGVELDAHQRYWDLTTRRGHGEAVANEFTGCRYVSGSVMDVAGTYTFMTWFLPFVTQASLRYWGLPSAYFQPGVLLWHAWSLLATGGLLFVVNQGEEERDAQRVLFAQHNIQFHDAGLMDSVFSPYRRRRYGWWAVKD